MNNTNIKFFLMFLITGLLATVTQTGAQTSAYRVSDSSVQSILTSIESKTDRYKRNMNSALDRSRYNNTDTEDYIFERITMFENATDRLKQRFDAKESVESDVTTVLNGAVLINKFMTSHSLTRRAQRNWSGIRSELNTLAGLYGIEAAFKTAISTGTPIYLKPYRVDDKSVSVVLNRIESTTDIYRRSMDPALDKSTLNDTESEDRLLDYITEFENLTDKLKQKFDARESVASDVTAVLGKASSIEAFMTRNQLTNVAERNWRAIRSDLDLLAGYYNVDFDWSRTPIDSRTTAYVVSGQLVGTLLKAIETKADIYKRAMNTALDKSVLNDSKSEDAIFEYISAFENSTDRLRQRYEANESTDKDVWNVLNRAAYIDTFMRDYRLMRSAERQWRSLRADLETLSGYYAVSWDWDRQYDPQSEFDAMLTGTYQLNSELSDDVDKVVENTVRIYPKYRERMVERRLKNRLISPKMVAINKSGLDIELGSSVAAKVAIKADGLTRTETSPAGDPVAVNAKTTYDGFTLSYISNGTEDFFVNFVRLDNGQLRVIRRIDLDYNNETLTIASVYEKVDNLARFDAINETPILTTGQNAAFLIPNGTQLTAELVSDEISTKSSVDGDRFRMKILTPAYYRDAILEGHVVSSKRSGIFSGRANVSLAFDKIRMENGEEFKFAGLIENVTLTSGEKVTVNSEGQVRDNNQTTKTAKRAGIGAGVGAILGAILGGGEGAAIGAAVGAGAGAGTVLAQGRDDVEIEKGSSFVITAAAPAESGSER